MLQRFLLWISPAARRRRAQELEEEMQADLAMAREDGAGREFGSLTRAREDSRAVWFPGWDNFASDVRYAARTLRRSPGFTSVAVLSLALGIGSATALFSVVDTVVLKPLSYREPGRLVLIREVVPALSHLYPTIPANFLHFRFWREQSRSFESLGAFTTSTATLTDNGESEVLGGVTITANLFDLLGTRPVLGRAFRAEEEQPGRNLLVIITDGLWRRRFGASPDIIGRSITLNGQPHEVVGVLPPDFRFPKKTDLGSLPPLSERTEIFRPIGGYSSGWGGDYDFLAVGRLRQGVTPRQAGAELDLLEKRITEEHKASVGLHTIVRPMQDVIASPVRTALAVLLSAVLVLVLIVCVNLANLLLARGSARAREFSLRTALGAGRSRLLSSALVETLMLSTAGGILGVGLARVAIGVFVGTAPVEIPRLDEIRLDVRVALFAFGLSLLCGLLFGLLPALRLSKADPQSTLRAGTHNLTGSRGGLRTREWLVCGEVALSTLLLVLAGLLIGSLSRVLGVDRGFDSRQAVAMRVQLPGTRYREGAARSAFFDQLLERLAAIPGVREAAYGNGIPLTGDSNINGLTVKGAADAAMDPATKQSLIVNIRFVSPRYFAALGIPLIQGRVIEPADRERNVALVSARLAAKLWPGGSALGKIISTGSRVGEAEIVGVVGDIHTSRLDHEPTLVVYTPFWKLGPGSGEIVVRSAVANSAVMLAMRQALRSMDSSMPAPLVRTLDDLVQQNVADRRFQRDVAGMFALSALLLAALGIYGVVAYSIVLRRRELGIRLALGADIAGVRRLVVGQGLRPVAAGLAIGIAVSLMAGRLIRGVLFGVSPNDPTTLAGVAAALGLVALFGCLLPAHGATRIDPIRVLREE